MQELRQHAGNAIKATGGRENISVAVEAGDLERICEMAFENTARVDAIRRLLRPMDNPERFSDAVADVNCWLGGYVAGGHEYEPGTREVLKDLRRALLNLGEIL